ncbi:MAG: hypothetical protein AB1546_15230 [bacterium]
MIEFADEYQLKQNLVRHIGIHPDITYFSLVVFGVFLLILGFPMPHLLNLPPHRIVRKIFILIASFNLFMFLISLFFYIGINFLSVFYLDDQVYYHETLYAAGYNDKQFRRVHQGDNIYDVKEKLGDPLRILHCENGTNIWKYTIQGPKGTHYVVREIEIGRDKKVKRTRAFYFVD